MNYIKLQEKSLISKSKKGDTLAFEELLSRNRDKLRGWCISFCKNEHEAEECYQKTTIKCWSNIKKFKGKSKFLTWACCIARNSFYDEWRRKKRRPTTSLDAMMEDGKFDSVEKLLVLEPKDQAIDRIDSKEVVETIKNKLDNISPQHKEALMLFVEEGYQYKDIAKKQNCPVGTVMSRIFYAKKEARKYLKSVYTHELG